MPSGPWPLTTSIEEIYDPKIRRAADRAYDIATLAATKAMLHVVDNSRYPIGTVRQGFGLERAFLGRLNALPRQKRDRIVSVMTTAFREGTTWRRRYAKLARVTKSSEIRLLPSKRRDGRRLHWEGNQEKGFRSRHVQ